MGFVSPGESNGPRFLDSRMRHPAGSHLYKVAYTTTLETRALPEGGAGPGRSGVTNSGMAEEPGFRMHPYARRNHRDWF